MTIAVDLQKVAWPAIQCLAEAGEGLETNARRRSTLKRGNRICPNACECSQLALRETSTRAQERESYMYPLCHSVVIARYTVYDVAQ